MEKWKNEENVNCIQGTKTKIEKVKKNVKITISVLVPTTAPYMSLPFT